MPPPPFQLSRCFQPRIPGAMPCRRPARSTCFCTDASKGTGTIEVVDRDKTVAQISLDGRDEFNHLLKDYQADGLVSVEEPYRKAYSVRRLEDGVQYKPIYKVKCAVKIMVEDTAGNARNVTFFNDAQFREYRISYDISGLVAEGDDSNLLIHCEELEQGKKYVMAGPGEGPLSVQVERQQRQQRNITTGEEDDLARYIEDRAKQRGHGPAGLGASLAYRSHAAPASVQRICQKKFVYSDGEVCVELDAAIRVQNQLVIAELKNTAGYDEVSKMSIRMRRIRDHAKRADTTDQRSNTTDKRSPDLEELMDDVEWKHVKQVLATKFIVETRIGKEGVVKKQDVLKQAQDAGISIWVPDGQGKWMLAEDDPCIIATPGISG